MGTLKFSAIIVLVMILQIGLLFFKAMKYMIMAQFLEDKYKEWEDGKR